MTPPWQPLAVEMGCSCSWYGPKAIGAFDKDCPIFHLHHVPADATIRGSWRDSDLSVLPDPWPYTAENPPPLHGPPLTDVLKTVWSHETPTSQLAFGPAPTWVDVPPLEDPAETRRLCELLADSEGRPHLSAQRDLNRRYAAIAEAKAKLGPLPTRKRRRRLPRWRLRIERTR